VQRVVSVSPGAEVSHTGAYMAGHAAASILTPDQRPRVFVSSTLQELAAERAAVRAGIEALGLIPVMFELGARPHPARALYRAYLAQSHLFVGLYFERYGWVAPGEDVSGLEDEYRLSDGLPRLVYLKTPAPDREDALKALVARIRDDDTVAYKSFSSADELGRLVRDDLVVLLSERFLIPAVAEGTVDVIPSTGVALGTPVPQPLSSLIGREAEVAAVAGLLSSDARLVTVVGPGGIGKTRVAIEAARRASSNGSGAVVFVPLEGVEDPAAVLPQVAASIGFGLDGVDAPVDALTAVFADRPVLLVIDNFEQVQAAAPDIAGLLARCPDVSALVTSRVPLKIRGEQVLPLGPLGLPTTGDRGTWEEAAAVRLFLDRARAARPGLTLDDPRDADAVVELCRRLDGIPLALELAAARSALLAPRTLLDRIGTALDLTVGTADLPPRQRTLRDTLAWSQQLLSPTQSDLLARLSMFVAPWTVSDAEAVADPSDGDVLDDLAGLIENSLVAPAPDALGEPRFRLYETVRAFAAELLHDAARDQTEAAYIARLSHQASELSGRRRSRDWQRWQTEFRLVWPDLHRAWQLALERRDAEQTVMASMSLLPLWLDGSALKAYDLVAPSLRLADEARPPRHGDLVFVCAQAAYTLGDYERAAQLLDRIGRDVELPSDPDLVAATTLMRGYAASDAGDLDTCERELRRSVELFEPQRSTGANWYQGFAHTGLGSLLDARGDVDGAISEFAEAQQVGRDSGNVGAQMQGLVYEADVHFAAGRHDRALDLLMQACPLIEVQPFFEGNAYFLEAVGAYAAEAGNPRDGVRLLGMATALRDLLGAQIWALLEARCRRVHDLVRSASPAEDFDAAFAEGRTLDPRSGADLCRALLRPPTTSAGAGPDAARPPGAD
jgi:predicted ATPase